MFKNGGFRMAGVLRGHYDVVLFFRKGIMGDRELSDLFSETEKISVEGSGKEMS